jgi:coenzyme F420-reducing hydrogenase beta subunit
MQFLSQQHKLVIVIICLQGKHEHAAATVIATSENVTLNSVERLDSGTYKCIAKNDPGREVSARVIVHVTCKYGLNL